MRSARGLVRPAVVLPIVASSGLLLGVVLATAGVRTVWLAPVAVAVGAFSAILLAARPLWACAVLVASSSFGNASIPSGRLGLQVVHLLTATTVLSVLLGLRQGRLRIPHPVATPVRRTLLAAASFVVWVVLATTLSVDPMRSFKSATTLLAGLLVAWSIVIVAQNPKDLRFVLEAFVLGSLPLSIQAMLQAGDARSVFSGAVVSDRPSGYFAEPNALGLFCAIVMLVSLGLWIWSPTWQARSVSLAGGTAGLLATLALAASLSRGAWLGAVLGLLTFIALYHPVVRVLARVGLFVLAAWLFASVSGVFGSLPSILVARMGTLAGGESNPYDVRPLTWAEALRQFSESPILGHGPGSFAVLSASWPSEIQFYPRVHAHNGLLTMATETGLVGVAAVLAVVVFSTVATLRTPGRDPIRIALFSSLVAVGGHLFVDYPLRNPVLMLTVWSVLGLLLASVEVGRRTSRSGTPSSGADAVLSGLAPVGREHE